MVEKTKYVKTIRETAMVAPYMDRPKNMVAIERRDLASKIEGCIIIQFAGYEPEDFHTSHLEYITKKEYFLRSLQGPDEIE